MNVSSLNQVASVAQQTLSANTSKPAATQSSKPAPQQASRPAVSTGNKFDAMA
ncbi:MAG: hypothetical protein ACRCY4_01155 [Brevinema sp.]